MFYLSIYVQYFFTNFKYVTLCLSRSDLTINPPSAAKFYKNVYIYTFFIFVLTFIDYILFSCMFTDLNLKYTSKEINLQLQDLKRRGSE